MTASGGATAPATIGRPPAPRPTRVCARGRCGGGGRGPEGGGTGGKDPDGGGTGSEPDDAGAGATIAATADDGGGENERENVGRNVSERVAFFRSSQSSPASFWRRSGERSTARERARSRSFGNFRPCASGAGRRWASRARATSAPVSVSAMTTRSERTSMTTSARE